MRMHRNKEEKKNRRKIRKKREIPLYGICNRVRGITNAIDREEHRQTGIVRKEKLFQN